MHFHTQHAFSLEFWLVNNSQHQGTECQFVGLVHTEYAPGTPVFKHVMLFLFSLMHPFCCAACGQLLV
jgi:hypothetical protein